MADTRLKQTAVATAGLYNQGSFATTHFKIIALIAGVLLTSCAEKVPATQASSATESHILEKPEKTPSSIKINKLIFSEAQLEIIVKEVMSKQYGSRYDSVHDCWPYTSADSVPYCMRPSAAKFINIGNSGEIYFYAVNRSDINDDPSYGYGQSDSGLMGAFKLSVDSSKGRKYSAVSKAMDFGSAGYCGCDKAKLVKLGNDDYYGWMFTSGGVWQGVVVSNYEIVAPKDAVFKNLSGIPEIREEEQDITYQIKIIDSSADSIFPLLITKVKSGSAPEEKTISFDQEKWMYSLPKDF